MSHRIYALALHLLPRGFRDEFGREMLHAFIDSRGALLANVIDVIVLSARLRLDQLRLDLRHAVRGLLRQKTFTITAMLTLALALGPATAVVSLIHGVLFDPLPGVTRVDRLVFAYNDSPERNRHEFPWSEQNFVDHRARQQGFAALGAYTSTSATIGGESPQQVLGAWVSPDMFDVLGTAIARGRRFEAADTTPAAAPTIILADHFARTRFPNTEAVGQTLIVDGRPTAIIGVLPPGVRFPEGEDNFWQPLVIDPARSARSQTYLRVLGRLADGVTAETVQQQMNLVAADLERQYPEANAGYRIEVKPAAAQLTRTARRTITVLGLAAVAIFLLACTNIASLLVVRTAGRQAELSVRTALGASASRLSRQLMIEHLVLAAAAAVAAAAIAAGLHRLLALGALIPEEQLARATLGAPAILFLIALMAVTAVVLGWIVSRRAMRAAATSTTLRTQSATRDTVRLRQALVSVEVGAAVVLLLAATLLLQSAARLLAVDPGFRADNVITFTVGLPMSRYMEPAARVQFIDRVVENLAKLPGVSAATSGAYSPMTTMRATRRFAIAGRPMPPPGTEPIAIDLPAGPDYARVMGLRLIDGRWITERDRIDAPPVVVISESFATRHFPGERAVGQRLQYYSGRPTGPPAPAPEIVGVVSDVRQFAMAEAEAPQMYVPHAQRAWTFAAFFVRTAGDPRAVFASLPAAVHAVDPERPLERVRTLDEAVRSSTASRRGLSGLLLIAAVIALLISTLGVYGVTAATTAARKRELAIRAAIGANQGGLIRLVVRQGMLSAVVGVIVGGAGAMAASGLLESVLYEVEPRNPWTFAIVAIALLVVCGVATFLPARRAVATSPAVALNEPAS